MDSAHDVIEQIWMPIAVQYGIPVDEFWHMNPKKITKNFPYYKEEQRRKQQDLYDRVWLMGQYMKMAVGSVLSKHGQYPDAPPDLYEEKPTSEEEIVITASERFRASCLESNKQRFGIASLKSSEIREKEG